ncbi:MAG: hypothetical protein WC700_17100 [Gemmatimonadaceae bacterium]|jgi:hypothetical protein
MKHDVHLSVTINGEPGLSISCDEYISTCTEAGTFLYFPCGDSPVTTSAFVDDVLALTDREINARRFVAFPFDDTQLAWGVRHGTTGCCATFVGLNAGVDAKRHAAELNKRGAP